MAFPHITVKATNLDLSSSLSELIDLKLASVGKLIPDTATDGHCRVEVERLTEHRTGKIFRVEANLFVQGTAYRAEATEEQVEKAVDTVRDELKRKLEHSNGKHKSLLRRGGQAIKRMLRFD